METFEARPKSDGSYPGIVVLMEAFGLNDHIKKVTERIAQEGYVAVAPIEKRCSRAAREKKESSFGTLL